MPQAGCPAQFQYVQVALILGLVTFGYCQGHFEWPWVAFAAVGCTRVLYPEPLANTSGGGDLDHDD